MPAHGLPLSFYKPAKQKSLMRDIRASMTVHKVPIVRYSCGIPHAAVYYVVETVTGRRIPCKTRARVAQVTSGW